MREVLLGCDSGEASDTRGQQIEIELLKHVDAVSIACGGHAGDVDSMRRMVELARTHGCLIGAHPSYPDRAGFGRLHVDITAESLEQSVSDQLCSFMGVLDHLDQRVSYVKAHGALYHALAQHTELAIRFWEWSEQQCPGSKLVMPLGCHSLEKLRSEHTPVMAEGFCDRAYGPSGMLIPRGEAGATIDDPDRAADQAERLVREGNCDLLCIHADTEHAIEVAIAVRERIDSL
jgi:UPF0271 protein